jgi:hypothetical protein
VNLRRWYTALGLAAVCLVFAIGATSSEAVNTRGDANTPRLLAATAIVTQPTVVTATSPITPSPAFGSYAVIAIESLLAAAFLCYAFLQLRRAAQAAHAPWTIRLRGPPSFFAGSVPAS